MKKWSMKLGSKKFLKEDLQGTSDEERLEKAPTLRNSDILNRKSNKTKSSSLFYIYKYKLYVGYDNLVKV